MAVPEKQDALQKSAGRLISQWHDSRVLKGITYSEIKELEDLEVFFNQLLTERDIYSARGINLEIIGELLGVQRQGLPDSLYRQAILNRVSANLTSGTPEELLALVRRITGQPVARIWEHLPFGIFLYGPVPITNYYALNLAEASPATSNVRYIFDNNGDGFIPTELTIQQYILVDEQERAIVVTDEIEDDYYLRVGGPSTDSAFEHSFLPEVVETTTINPLSDILDQEQFRIDIFTIVDEFGNTIINENDSDIIGAELRLPEEED